MDVDPVNYDGSLNVRLMTTIHSGQVIDKFFPGLAFNGPLTLLLFRYLRSKEN